MRVALKQLLSKTYGFLNKIVQFEAISARKGRQINSQLDGEPLKVPNQDWFAGASGGVRWDSLAAMRSARWRMSALRLR